MKAYAVTRRTLKYIYKRTTVHHFRETFHAHQGMEFCIIHEGKGRLILNQEIIPLHSGMILYFQPFQLHRVQMDVNENTPFIRSILILEPSEMIHCLKPFPYLMSFFKTLWEEELPSQVIRNFHRNKPFEQLLKTFHAEMPEFAPERFQEEFSLFFISFLQHLRKMWEKEKKQFERKQRELHHAERMMRWIETHYAENFQLERLAEDLHLSKYYASHLFKDATGSTLTEYITARRIRQACLLLNTTAMTIKEIAFQTGFSNSAYFTKTFRENVGVTPKEYRRQRFLSSSNI